MDVYCPATMCPLIAPDGSPWTGEVNSVCSQKESECLWFDGEHSRCQGGAAAHCQVREATNGEPVLQLVQIHGIVPRESVKRPTEYDCQRAAECQWQRESSPYLCPPRQALANGLDPRVCLY